MSKEISVCRHGSDRRNKWKQSPASIACGAHNRRTRALIKRPHFKKISAVRVLVNIQSNVIRRSNRGHQKAISSYCIIISEPSEGTGRLITSLEAAAADAAVYHRPRSNFPAFSPASDATWKSRHAFRCYDLSSRVVRERNKSDGLVQPVVRKIPLVCGKPSIFYNSASIKKTAQLWYYSLNFQTNLFIKQSILIWKKLRVVYAYCQRIFWQHTQSGTEWSLRPEKLLKIKTSKIQVYVYFNGDISQVATSIVYTVIASFPVACQNPVGYFGWNSLGYRFPKSLQSLRLSS